MTAPATAMSAMPIRNWTGGGDGSGLDQGATCARAGVQDAARAAKAEAEAVRFIVVRHLRSRAGIGPGVTWSLRRSAARRC
jgi:hypothetical protein